MSRVSTNGAGWCASMLCHAQSTCCAVICNCLPSDLSCLQGDPYVSTNGQDCLSDISCSGTQCELEPLSLYSSLLKNTTALAEVGGFNVIIIALVVAAVVLTIETSIPISDPRDTLPWEWNAKSVAGYWSRRPVAVARRTVAVTSAAFSVGLALLIDRVTGKSLILHV